MIAEDYVSYETAKLLKEKGFDEATHQYYKTITYLGTEANNVCIKTLDGIESEPFNNSIYGFDLNGEDTGEYACPTLQMAMKWLREVHKLYCDIRVGDGDFVIDIISLKDGEFGCEVAEPESCVYPTYEEAAETAIKYCLENLI